LIFSYIGVFSRKSEAFGYNFTESMIAMKNDAILKAEKNKPLTKPTKPKPKMIASTK
jgi:hypothetical protein